MDELLDPGKFSGVPSGRTVAKLGVSAALGLAGMYLLYAGRRDRDWRKLVWAGALALASLLFY